MDVTHSVCHFIEGLVTRQKITHQTLMIDHFVIFSKTGRCQTVDARREDRVARRTRLELLEVARASRDGARRPVQTPCAA